MPELQDAGRMLEGAEQAAIADDLESADELLRGAARIQEAELGPLHPDLANTLNNLAIVAEKTGRLSDAEAFYRRAVAIATAALPVDHPMIAASRENLEAFCRARDLPVETAAEVALPEPAAATKPEPAATDPVSGAAWPTEVEVTRTDPALDSTPPQPDLPLPEVRPPTPVAPRRVARVPSSRAPTWMAIGLLVVPIAILVTQAWLSRSTSPSPSAVLTTPRTDAAARPATADPPARAVPLEWARSPTAARRPEARDTPTNQTPAPSPSSDALTLATAELCQDFSTSGDGWRCTPAGDQVSPGRIVLYTRVRSARDGTVVHRWYRGSALQQSVRLTTQANAKQGYRTYSRQTVAAADEWRVEVRSATGVLLHERRFAVR